MNRAELVRRLMNDEYGLVFYWPQHDFTVSKIYSEPGNPELLEQVLNDPSAPGRPRFIAAEVLFARDFTFIDRTRRDDLAQLYCEALVENWAGHANVFGMLWDHDDVGPVGGRFVLLGRDALPALTALLDNNRVVDWYAGSEEATVANGYGYRIKDFAAFYLGRILNVSVPFHRDPAQRDAEIAKLRDALPRQ